MITFYVLGNVIIEESRLYAFMRKILEKCICIYHLFFLLVTNLLLFMII